MEKREYNIMKRNISSPKSQIITQYKNEIGHIKSAIHTIYKILAIMLHTTHLELIFQNSISCSRTLINTSSAFLNTSIGASLRRRSAICSRDLQYCPKLELPQRWHAPRSSIGVLWSPSTQKEKLSWYTVSIAQNAVTATV